MSEASRSPPRAGFVAVVGRPNAGKSTFVNLAVGEKVAAVSPKPQTTRDRIRGICTEARGQMVLVDTPGIHRARGRKEINRRMVQAAMATLQEVDCVLHIVDASAAVPAAGLKRARDRQSQDARRRPKVPSIHPLDREIARGIASAGRPAVLLLNKVDRVQKPALLPLLAALSELGGAPYAELIPASARDRRDVARVLDLLWPLLPEGPALYPEDQITDKNQRFLVTEIIRERLFFETQQELPYSTAVVVDSFGEEEEGGRLVIHATILVERESQKGMIIGKGGQKLRSIGQSARQDIQRALGRGLHLDLRVKLEERWSERPQLLDELGYRLEGEPS